MRRRFFYNKSEKDAYLTIEALEDGLSVSFDPTMSNSIEYSIDESQNWKILQYDATTDSILKGQKIKFRGYCVPTHEGIGRFHITHKCKLYGNCMSLLYYDKASLFNRVLEFSFYELFFDCPIISVSNDFLPATILAESCYKRMFIYCSSMIEAPELPATTLAESCYYDMFCGCTKLNYIKMLAIDISATDCLVGWVDGVSSTGTFVKHPNMTSLPTGVNGIPEGWTVVNDGEEEGGNDFGIEFPLYLTFDECTTNWVETECVRYADDISKKLFEVLKDVINQYGESDVVTGQILELLGIEIYIENLKITDVQYYNIQSEEMQMNTEDGRTTTFISDGTLIQNYIIN